MGNRYQVDDDIEPEIKRLLTVRHREVPTSLEPRISESELNKFPLEQRPLVFAISRVGEYAQWACYAVVELNGHVRLMEANHIRFKQKLINRVIWLVGVLVSALISAIMAYIFK